jgi:hypothetical protein
MAYIDIDLDDFDDTELIDELRYRGYTVFKQLDNSSPLENQVHKIFDAMYLGKPHEELVKKLVYDVTGRIV